jgi:hypothetical protein
MQPGRRFKQLRPIGDMSDMAHTPTSLVNASRFTASKMPRPSTRLLAAALGLAFALSSTAGCMVMDELDNAAAKMPTSAAEKKAKAEGTQPKAATSPADRLAAAKSRIAAHSQKWWSEAKTMTPGEAGPAGIVRCRLPEGTKFMSTDDCLSQGGQPADGAG